MYETLFKEINLTVIELPIELIDEQPIYTAYLKELPMISASGKSRQAMYHDLVLLYQTYVEQQFDERYEEQVEMTSSLLSADQLLKYYDGESFDGFSLFD